MVAMQEKVGDVSSLVRQIARLPDASVVPNFAMTMQRACSQGRNVYSARAARLRSSVLRQHGHAVDPPVPSLRFDIRRAICVDDQHAVRPRGGPNVAVFLCTIACARLCSPSYPRSAALGWECIATGFQRASQNRSPKLRSCGALVTQL